MVHHLPPGRRRFHHQLVDARRTLPRIDLRDPADGHEDVRPAPQHELLQRAHRLDVARSCRPEDALSQVADVPVGTPPIDGVPVGSPLRSVCKPGGLHLT